MAGGGKRPGAGRPRGAVNKTTADIKALAQKHGKEAIDTLVSLMRKGETEAVQHSASKELLDRGYGKAHQPLTGAEGGPLTVIVRKFADA